MRNSICTSVVLAFIFYNTALAAANEDEDGSERDSPKPGHSNFLRSNYLSGSQQWQFTWCAHNASVCKDPAKFPSGGTKCCWNRFCVDTKVDPSNCGGCNKPCTYGFSCCAGKCVDLLRDRKHCGSCDNICSKHSQCEFGLCGYASWEKKKPKNKMKASPPASPKYPW
ncbi:hypothetical protein SELMODRAFT_446593 [Selaginella moellendorffii]|uniref:Stigma-specific STIG1-like protein 1 n=1 Tax=Selaginella moellendorffii TaxID=88036 RepID=D8SSR0_SELML|nr:stigma-specific STIG1-like protein 3 [Selaginella moellendorffii]EFJ12622.1 hypothetical protein SELMODRAFT_446593 [Selaginella moellendorffii]|eukprot:XP_002986413.1 stigma-specific STIG1-like protein 3 [Selaginella moellendorffii]